MQFKQVYALEKVHGTSAHISYKDDKLFFYSGGAKHEEFIKNFNEEELLESFRALGQPQVVVFGEAYGGKMQAMNKTYGNSLKFVVFDVKIGELWLDVPSAEKISAKLNLEFVPYELVPSEIDVLNAERDRPSRIAKRRGIQEDRPAEGIVIRPPFEVRLNNGERVIAKHKREEFSERKSKADTVIDGFKAKILEEAKAIADEWATPMRLNHIIGKFPHPPKMEDISLVIQSMVSDVLKESVGEIVDSKEARKAIASKASKLFIEYLKKQA